ncbi:hypothetical protein HYV49_00145 [Candidatus Pacearchaeota archaeon]|nr:hypothetical protein [Candidatus Pacearchaeota archaeon]
MVSEKVIIVLLSIAILLSIVSLAVSLSAKVNTSALDKPINVKVPLPERTSDDAVGVVGITVEPISGG